MSRNPDEEDQERHRSAFVVYIPQARRPFRTPPVPQTLPSAFTWRPFPFIPSPIPALSVQFDPHCSRQTFAHLSQHVPWGRNPMPELVFIGNLEEPGFERVRVWKDVKGSRFYDCDCNRRKPRKSRFSKVSGFLILLQ
jgi:hypothetical protein